MGSPTKTPTENEPLLSDSNDATLKPQTPVSEDNPTASGSDTNPLSGLKTTPSSSTQGNTSGIPQEDDASSSSRHSLFQGSAVQENATSASSHLNSTPDLSCGARDKLLTSPAVHNFTRQVSTDNYQSTKAEIPLRDASSKYSLQSLTSASLEHSSNFPPADNISKNPQIDTSSSTSLHNLLTISDKDIKQPTPSPSEYSGPSVEFPSQAGSTTALYRSTIPNSDIKQPIPSPSDYNAPSVEFSQQAVSTTALYRNTMPNSDSMSSNFEPSHVIGTTIAEVHSPVESRPNQGASVSSGEINQMGSAASQDLSKVEESLNLDLGAFDLGQDDDDDDDINGDTTKMKPLSPSTVDTTGQLQKSSEPNQLSSSSGTSGGARRTTQREEPNIEGEDTVAIVEVDSPRDDSGTCCSCGK